MFLSLHLFVLILIQVLHEIFNGNAAVLHSLIHMQLLHYRPTHIRSVAMQQDQEDQMEPLIGVPSTVFLYLLLFSRTNLVLFSVHTTVKD